MVHHARRLFAAFAACLLPLTAGAAPATFVPGHIYSTFSGFHSRDIAEYDTDGDAVRVVQVTALGPDEDLKGLGFGLDGRLYVVVDDLFDSARLVALDASGTVLSSYPLPDSVGGNLSLGKLAFPDLSTALVASGAGLVKVNLKNGATQQFGAVGAAFDVEVLPNGNLLVAENYQVSELNGASGAVVRRLSFSDPNRISAATFFSVNDLRGIEFDAATQRLYLSMLGNSDNLFFKTMAFDYATGALTAIASFSYGDDMYLGADGTLLIGSRTEAPRLLSKANLGLVRQLSGASRMFVTRYEPPAVLPAVAYDDLSPLVLSGTAITLDVLANDVNFGDPVSVTLISTPGHGSATVIGSPGPRGGLRIDYVSDAGYVGADSFVYQVSDGVHTDTATVTVTNSAAKAFDDAVTAVKGNPLEIDVLANDVGFADPVSLAVIGSPSANGTAYATSAIGPAAAVRVTYLPYCCSGEDEYTETFSYQVSDGVSTDTAKVTVRVVSHLARDDVAHTNVGTQVSVPVGANDLGFDFGAQFEVFAQPAHGSVSLLGAPGDPADYRIDYTPAPGFVGTDTFQYALDDGVHVGVARVTVTVRRDVDLDGIGDEADNCITLANADQRDSNGDGFGNRCDADLNGDRLVNFADLNAMKLRFASRDADADLNGDRVVNFADLALLRTLFGKPPGPSALRP